MMEPIPATNNADIFESTWPFATPRKNPNIKVAATSNSLVVSALSIRVISSSTPGASASG